MAEQEAITLPLPGDLNMILNAKNSLAIGPFTQVFGDIGASSFSGTALLDVSSFQNGGGRLLANIVTVRFSAQAGQIIGNDITVDGFAASQTLGLDPEAMPQVPVATAATPGATVLSVAANQAKQACPGQYGAMTLGTNSTLNLNGGVYHVTRLNLAEGARLQPSEPVVIVVSGNVVTGLGARIEPSPQSIGFMAASDIRIEVAGAATLGESNLVRAHLLVPNGRLSTGRNTALIGAGWARNITIGSQNFIASEGQFSLVTPSVAAPCNDNNACTLDQCVAAGTTAFCRNTNAPSGTLCADGNTCNGAETCNGAGQCQPGTVEPQGTLCLDGDACNGNETCDGVGTCVAGAPPVVDDGNTCTADSCDPGTGVANDPLPDGTTCSGSGVCEGGVCSIEQAVFSETFFQGETAVQQCGAWNNFIDNLLVSSSYNRITMSGSFDPNGVTCTNPIAATQICQALHNRTVASVVCDGHTWNVGDCIGPEISVDTGVCLCQAQSRSVRPCIFNLNWGGVNTQTCGAPTQNMTVVCE